MIGARDRMQASETPHTFSAPAINQASKGGFEKYPDASSRDHDQYWAFSHDNILGFPIAAPQDDLRPLDELTRLHSAATDPLQLSPVRINQ